MDWKTAGKAIAKALKSFFRKPGQLDAELVAAARANDLKKAQELIAEGATLNTQRFGAENPLAAAAAAGHVEMVRLLLDKGADPKSPCDYGGSSAFLAAVKQGSVEIVTEMLARGADANQRNFRRETALMFAAGAKNLPLVELLLEKGADIDARDNARWRPLTYAMHAGEPALVTLLLQKGARTNIVDEDRHTLFDVAEASDKPAARQALQEFMDARTPEWQALGPQSVAHTGIFRPLGYKLTEVFNFETSQCTVVSHNFATGKDTLVQRSFAELGEETVKVARAKLPAAVPVVQGG
jgi:ankyrin repeat protein